MALFDKHLQFGESLSLHYTIDPNGVGIRWLLSINVLMQNVKASLCKEEEQENKLLQRSSIII